ncbi:hypothetical protein DdX_04585 [Ditylenchus destructor]|uniref:Uncharacterized protein n=1 Tax=Ditylenchus destructor TaxID=166010 RepID=A0AAD4RAW9_9BILA|nr:hypothetical protein DdX_04585 [Ditylenchus destructor]
MSQPQEKRHEDDPYYIPSVPMYKPLGDEFLDMDETIGDKFFDQYTELGTQTPQREIFDRDYREQQEDRKKDKNANKENVVVPPVPVENAPKQPLVRRRSRSLIKPGRASVGSKASVQNSEHKNTQISNNNSTTAKNPVIVRRPSLSVMINNKPNVANAVKPAAGMENVFSPVSSYRPTQPKPTQINVVKSTTGVFATKQHFSPRRLRSSKVEEQEGSNKEKNVNQENFVSAPAPRENAPKQPLLRRRSRSLIKPGRASVGSKASVQNSEHEITQISNDNSTTVKNPVIVRRPSLSVVNTRPNVANAAKPAVGMENISSPVSSYRPTQPKPAQINVVKSTTGVFATKQHFSPRRLRSSTKDAMNNSKTGSSPMAPTASNGPLNSANSKNLNNNDKPQNVRCVSGNYMAPTIASARRLSDVKERRRSRLGP